MNDVWVTGIGTVGSFGSGRESFLNALLENRFCADSYKGHLNVSHVARIPQSVSIPTVFEDDRKSNLGLYVAQQAIEDAGLNIEEIPPEDIAIFLGTGLSSITPDEIERDIYPHIEIDENGKSFFSRTSMAKSLSPNLPSPKRHLPQRLTSHLQRKYASPLSKCGTSFSACAAAAQAIAEGMRCLRRGQANVALVGGHDSMDHPMGLLSFDVLGALSSDFCRPFDIQRNGFMLGEGATILILETVEHAKKRGAQPLAKLVGAGTSVDAHKATAPHPDGEGAYLAMKRALRDAQISPSDIQYVNAHGTGTPLGDIAESKAVQRLFGAQQPTSSIKGAIGHTVAAAGAMEAAACILSLQNSFLPGTVGFENQDTACQVDVVSSVRRQSHFSYALSNSFGFGGQNCSLIFQQL